ncbi:MAG: hypothetical protein MJY62_00550 [Bacteroidales bacterium]|nr:hypothetical protein [Bacteroidales bacterium]
MKKILEYIAIAATVGFSAVSCEVDYQFPDPSLIPQYQIKEPVVGAKATAPNGFSVNGEITALNEDHTRYTIDFNFDANGIDLSRLNVEINYCSRTKLLDGAPDGPTVMDLDHKSHVMKVNDIVQDVEYTISAAVIPCKNPIISAIATSDETVEKAEIDNEAHTISFFVTSKSFDLSAMNVTLEYNPRATPGEKAFTTAVVDLTSPYEFRVFDSVNTLTYTMTAVFLNKPVLIPFSNINVFRVDGDAIVVGPKSMYPDNPDLGVDGSDVKYMFDGQAALKYGGNADIKHQQMFWRMSDQEIASGHGDFLLFDVSEPAKVSQVALHPYSNYEYQDPLMYAIYAYTASNTVAPTSFQTYDNDWTLIVNADDSPVWVLEQAVKQDASLIGTGQDPMAVQQIHKTIEGVQVPKARFYAFVMLKNCYELHPTVYPNASARKHWCSITELEVWSYQYEDNE